MALPLNSIDEAIAEHMGVPVHPTAWCYDWYNVIGFAIAMGKPLGSAELRQRVADFWGDDDRTYTAQLLKVLDYLEANYVSDAFVEIGRR